VFESPTSYLCFFFFLAMLDSLSRADEALPQSGLAAVPGWAVAGACVAAIWGVYVLDVVPARANQAAFQMVMAVDREPITGSRRDRNNEVQRPPETDSLVHLDRSIELESPHADGARNLFAGRVLANLQRLKKARMDARARTLAHRAYDALEKNAELHPLDVRVRLGQAKVALALATILGDRSKLAEANSGLTEALPFSPRRQELVSRLVDLKLQLGQLSEALALSRQVVDNRPDGPYGYLILARTQAQLGRYDQALETLRAADKREVPFTGPAQQQRERLLQAVHAARRKQTTPAPPVQQRAGPAAPEEPQRGRTP
jgi:hypothetical protein